MRCDSDGNLWCSWGDTNGVRVHAPDGDLVAILHTPEIVSNLCFGGLKGNRLFIDRLIFALRNLCERDRRLTRLARQN